jgi:hypothetical protein
MGSKSKKLIRRSQEHLYAIEHGAAMKGYAMAWIGGCLESLHNMRRFMERNNTPEFLHSRSWCDYANACPKTATKCMINDALSAKMQGGDYKELSACRSYYPHAKRVVYWLHSLTSKPADQEAARRKNIEQADKIVGEMEKVCAQCLKIYGVLWDRAPKTKSA